MVSVDSRFVRLMKVGRLLIRAGSADGGAAFPDAAWTGDWRVWR